MKDIFNEQLADDFSCTKQDVISKNHVFTVFENRSGRRKYEGDGFFELACVHGKILATGDERIIKVCKEKMKDSSAAWFMEYETLCKLDAALQQFDYKIGSAHPFFLGDTITHNIQMDGELVWYHNDEINQFRGDDRFDEAFAFNENAPDVLGVALIRDGKILGMAGASRDSARMYQIGINVCEDARGEHIGSYLVEGIKNELLSQGILPFYGTSMSHMTSQRVAIEAGFYPAWAELFAVKR